MAALEEQIRGEAIAVREIRSGGDTRIDGVVLGTAARDALTPAPAARWTLAPLAGRGWPKAG